MSHLAVVGAPALDDGAYEAALRVEASDLLGDRSRFVGQVEEVPAVLRSLDVLVNASTSEPFGLSVLEAQACGIPGSRNRCRWHPGNSSPTVKRDYWSHPANRMRSRLVAGRILDSPRLRRDARRRPAMPLSRTTLAVRAAAIADVYKGVAANRTEQRQ